MNKSLDAALVPEVGTAKLHVLCLLVGRRRGRTILLWVGKAHEEDCSREDLRPVGIVVLTKLAHSGRKIKSWVLRHSSLEALLRLLLGRLARGIKAHQLLVLRRDYLCLGRAIAVRHKHSQMLRFQV